MLRAFLAVLLTAAQIALLSAIADAAPAAASPITIYVSDDSVRLGEGVTVYGKGPARRRLVLQLLTSENGWQEMSALTAGQDGAYSFRAPAWLGTHQLRVVAQDALVPIALASSTTRRVTVKMSYQPRGQASDWTWLSDRGARWDPCRTVTYRINSSASYQGATDDIRGAFRQVGLVTGFRFEYLGTTTKEVTRNKYGYYPVGTDILVDWQSPKEDAGLSGGVAAIGGHWVQDGRRFNGYILLDRTNAHSRGIWRQVMNHELGHVLGLGHARTTSQQMYGAASSLNQLLGAGDLAALGRVGASQGCLKSPADRGILGSKPARIDSP